MPQRTAGAALSEPRAFLEPSTRLAKLAQLSCHDCQAAVEVGVAAAADAPALADAAGPQVPAQRKRGDTEGVVR
jgi:hypothetical protein